MAGIRQLVDRWFAIWNGEDDFCQLPITDDFQHISPYGKISGKDDYMRLVESNRDKFLGNRIVIHDALYDSEMASVRYTVSKGDFSMEVTEWLYCRDGLLSEIVAYYNIEGEISSTRKLFDDDLFDDENQTR